MCRKEECFLVETGYGFTNQKGERGFNRGNYISFEDIDKFAKNHNFDSVFSSAYRYSDKQIEKAELYGDLYLDFDDIKDFEHVRKDAMTALSYLKIVYRIEKEDVNIFYSGNKGVHITVPAEIFGIQPMHLLNGVFKHIASSIKSFTPNKTIDTVIYDNKRMFRLVNSMHEKSRLYKIPLTYEELISMPLKEIKEIARKKREINLHTNAVINHMAEKQFQRMITEFLLYDAEHNKDKKYSATLNYTPPCIKNLLLNGAEEGQRNISIACLTSYYRNSGKGLEETIELISEWNDNNTNPTPLRELKTTVKSIFNTERSYGCTTLSSVSVCEPKICKMSKENRKGSKTDVTKSKILQNESKCKTALQSNSRFRRG